MEPYHCWMSRHLLGQDADTLPEDETRVRAHMAFCKLMEAEVVNAQGNACEKPS